MGKLLINYPHGLGDCIMLTPALRNYYNKTGKKVHLVMLSRLKSAELFQACPYVDKIFYTKDPWHDYTGGFGVGKRKQMEEARNIAKINGDEFLYIEHPAPNHKINICANKLGVPLDSTNMEVYISNEDRKLADFLIKKFVGDKPFGFVQTITTGGSIKDMPEGFGAKWLKKYKNLDNIIEVGKEFKSTDFNINVQFEIMRRANAVCLPDSVFYHACIAMEKDIDFVYFGRGEGVYIRVKNLNNKVKENVSYKIPQV
jgi:hypothetical protein